eukprot:CAMPEP_0194031612 /NCGR_PEP_ID=MMETSP0009_2-20130614/4744_1 /TAXON_ID=210454 /ORGANISM="Grammatophora oceanica, Strain CCMP 410" /LENGTH=429 /DNA_ID=CAMNT_0038671819 /DNA_START=45 /DNA_END=1334 /DNA_ORIENTATION=-
MVNEKQSRRRTRSGIAVVVAATAVLATTVDGLASPHSSRTQQLLEFTRAGPPSMSTPPLVRSPGSSGSNLHPLSMVQCQDETEFELNLGHALDTLKEDYTHILTTPPDYSLYDEELQVLDPAGVSFHGLSKYKTAFKLIHTMVNLLYCKEQSLLTYRLVYDWTRSNIRVSWNAEVVPKAIFGGQNARPLHVDGISVYEVVRPSGQIVQHRIEHLVINDQPVAPKQGIFNALKSQVVADDGCGTIPCFSKGSPVTGGPRPLAKFQSWNPLHRQQKSLFADPKQSSTTSLRMASYQDDQGSPDYPSGLDVDAFEKKNMTRKKYGLKPLSPEEFLETEAQIQTMETQERKRQAAMDAATAPEDGPLKPFAKLFNVLEDTCETNYDCERPEVCCDFGFKKMCCSSGAMVGAEQQLRPAYATVPSTLPDMDDFY